MRIDTQKRKVQRKYSGIYIEKVLKPCEFRHHDIELWEVSLWFRGKNLSASNKYRDSLEDALAEAKKIHCEPSYRRMGVILIHDNL